MNCREWEERIAGEDPAAARHVAECGACATFARGLREALLELRAAHEEEEIAPAHYAAVRARVMAELRPRRRWVWAAAAVVIAVLGLGLRERMRVEELPDRPVVAVAPPAPAARAPKRAARRMKREEIVVRIEMEDPDLVIYWIAKGDD